MLCLLLLRPDLLLRNHSPADATRIKRIHNTAIYKELDKELPGAVRLVFNANSFEDIDAMFYNHELIVCPWFPDGRFMDSLKRNNVPFAAFRSHGQYTLPADISSYPRGSIINKDLW